MSDVEIVAIKNDLERNRRDVLPIAFFDATPSQLNGSKSAYSQLGMPDIDVETFL